MLDLECALGYKLIYTFKNINLQEKNDNNTGFKRLWKFNVEYEKRLNRNNANEKDWGECLKQKKIKENGIGKGIHL